MPKGLFAVPRRRGRRGFETVAFPHHTASRRTNLHAWHRSSWPADAG
jgi:hypothetical protein